MVAQSRGFRRRMDEAGQGVVLSPPRNAASPLRASVGSTDTTSDAINFSVVGPKLARGKQRDELGCITPAVNRLKRR